MDCVREKRPVIHNDYPALPHRKGLPDGHPPVIRELSIPIMRSGRVVAILGIGNKPEDYTQEDIEAASYLADIAWEIARRKRVEEELRENQSRLDLALRSSHMGAWRLDIVENRRWFDDQVCRLLGIAPGNSPEPQMRSSTRSILTTALQPVRLSPEPSNTMGCTNQSIVWSTRTTASITWLRAAGWSVMIMAGWPR